MSGVPEQPPQIDGVDRRGSGNQADLTFVCPDCSAPLRQLGNMVPGMLSLKCTNEMCQAELDLPLVVGGRLLPGGPW